jgi:hypothetical protein
MRIIIKSHCQSCRQTFCWQSSAYIMKTLIATFRPTFKRWISLKGYNWGKGNSPGTFSCKHHLKIPQVSYLGKAILGFESVITTLNVFLFRLPYLTLKEIGFCIIYFSSQVKITPSCMDLNPFLYQIDSIGLENVVSSCSLIADG